MDRNSDTKIILICGGSGLIGRALIQYFRVKNYKIRILSRKIQKIDGVRSFLWNPDELLMDHKSLEGAPIIINLAGEGIADKAWTKKRKELILLSRINSIRTIFNALSTLKIRSNLIINASGIGIYGNYPQVCFTEETVIKPNDFLSETVAQWEEEAASLKKFTDRLILARTSLVLAKEGGIWPKLIQTLNLKLLPWFGHGKQVYSWIHIEDLVIATEFFIENKELNGYVNLSAPISSSNKEIILSIKRALNKFVFCFSIPSFLLKIILGERSQLLLIDQHVFPQKLLIHGFNFKYPIIESAIHQLINKNKK